MQNAKALWPIPCLCVVKETAPTMKEITTHTQIVKRENAERQSLPEAELSPA